MVSYFLPRGRFLLRAGQLRQSLFKQQQLQQQQQQHGKWHVLGQLRNNFSTKSAAVHNVKQDAQVDKLVRQVRHNSSQHKSMTAKRSKHIDASQNQGEKQAWRRWTMFLLKLTPLGFCVFGAIDWHLNNRKRAYESLPITASEFQAKVYCFLPLRIISRCWGWLAACYMPTPLRSFVYGWYSQTFGVNLEEALHVDYKHYNSLSEFFTRPLKNSVREIEMLSPLVSPADGKILHFGSAKDHRIEQVKGVNYSLEDFLGKVDWKKNANGEPTTHADYTESLKEHHDDSTALFQCVVYLAPGDYHRFHSPTAWTPKLRRHFSGELLSVSPKIASWLPGLFCLNERVVYVGQWQHGFFSYSAVGATNVGSVDFYIDKQLKTNRWQGLKMGKHSKIQEYDELVLTEHNTGSDLKLNKGELLGQFNMGSTIVLLFEAPKNFKFTIEAGQKIKMGESLGDFLMNGATY